MCLGHCTAKAARIANEKRLMRQFNHGVRAAVRRVAYRTLRAATGAVAGAVVVAVGAASRGRAGAARTSAAGIGVAGLRITYPTPPWSNHALANSAAG